MNPIQVSMINSKAAQDHYADIKSQHADILMNMRMQNDRVAQYTAQKEMEVSQNESLKADQSMKQQELDIKRQALSL
jgi:hypothetical protein